MNFKKFTEEAKRTESSDVPFAIHGDMFTLLQTTTLQLMDCFDLIKKRAFYGKPIDADKFNARLIIADHSISELRNEISKNPEYIHTLDSDPTINSREFHGILGLLTEAGELLELIDIDAGDIDALKIVDELGDSFWYIAILADAKGIDIEQQVLEGVIAKLRKRFPDKFEAALAVTRDKDAELAETAVVTGIGDMVEDESVKKKGGRPRRDGKPNKSGVIAKHKRTSTKSGTTKTTKTTKRTTE